MAGEFVVVYNIMPEVAAKMLEAADKIIRKGAFDIQAAAQANIRNNGQVDTGFMVNSAYVVTDKESTYGNVGTPVEEGQEMLPELPRPPKHNALIAFGANYAEFQEFGTVKMGARPFLTPAVEQTWPSIEHAFLLLEARMAELSIPNEGNPGGGE